MHTYFQTRSITSRAADLGQWRRGDAGGDAAVVDLLEKRENFSIINGADRGGPRIQRWVFKILKE